MVETREIRCPCCRGRRGQGLYTVRDTNQDVPGRWWIVRCQGCGAGVLWPMPDAAQVASFYDAAFYTEQGERFAGPVEWLRSLLARLRGRKLNKLCPNRGRLLDYGSGAGHFVRAQRRNGWDAMALDPYNPGSDQADKVRFAPDGSVQLLYPDNHFQAVTLWYVIEHVPDPVGVLQELHRVLSPDGVLLLAQQDFGSVQARLFGPRWLILDPPRHLWQFDEDSLNRLALRAGFTPVAISRRSLELGPFTILQSLLNTLLGNRNYLFRFLKNPKLAASRRGWRDRLGALVSVLLFPIAALLALPAYFVLLALGSGDVFTMYYRKREDAAG